MFEAVDEKRVPNPSCMVVRANEGGTHTGWFHRHPVTRTNVIHGEVTRPGRVRQKPIRLHRLVSAYLCDAVGGDPAYAGPMTHTP